MANKLACRSVLALIAVLLWAPPVRAELVADLTSHLIAITGGFSGASVVLFGGTDGPGDAVVVVRGPERDMTVRRKERVAGIWANTQAVTFTNVPSFYAVATSRPMEEILAPEAAAFYRLGVANLKLGAETPASPAVIDAFRVALEGNQEQAGLFVTRMGKIDFLGERLFRTTITFPSNAPTGTYLVEVFQVRDKNVIAGQTTPLVVSKVGFVAGVFEFANRSPDIYAIICALVASLTDLILSTIFT